MKGDAAAVAKDAVSVKPTGGHEMLGGDPRLPAVHAKRACGALVAARNKDALC